MLCFLQIKIDYCILPSALFTQENNTKVPVLLCHIGPPNKEAMIERMKTTEVNIKMDERLQVTEKTADD